MTSKKVLVVDGYNVIHRIPELEASLDGGLESARNRLALHLSAWARLHPGFECVIVFDGDPRFLNSQARCLAGIGCLYSRTPHGGDEEIIRFVREFRGRKADITVVSDDNHVGNNCRVYGANVVPSSFIMSKPARRPSRVRASAAAGKGMNPRQVAAINEELRAKYRLK